MSKNYHVSKADIDYWNRQLDILGYVEGCIPNANESPRPKPEVAGTQHINKMMKVPVDVAYAWGGGMTDWVGIYLTTHGTDLTDLRFHCGDNFASAQDGFVFGATNFNGVADPITGLLPFHEALRIQCPGIMVAYDGKSKVWQDMEMAFSRSANQYTPGYIKFPNGFTIQWGRIQLDVNVGKSVTFPVAFTNLFSVVCQVDNMTAGSGFVKITGQRAASFDIIVGTLDIGNRYDPYWIALGFITP